MSEKLLDALRIIKGMKKEPGTPAICRLVKDIITDRTDEAVAHIKLSALFERWPLRAEYTSVCCPVEGSYAKYSEAVADKTIWNNPRRHALLDYLIEELEKENGNCVYDNRRKM